LQALNEHGVHVLAMAMADEQELAVLQLARDARENIVMLWQEFRQRLAAPEGDAVRSHSEAGARRRAGHRLPIFVVVDRQPRQPHQALGVVRLRIHRLHQVAGEEVVKRRHAAGDRLTPAVALHRREALGGQPHRHRVDADLGVNQHVRPVGQDGLAPALQWQRTLHEARAQRAGGCGLGVLPLAGIVTEQLETVAVQPGQPTFDRDLPIGMVAEKSADNADADTLPGCQRRQRRGRIARRHHGTDKLAVQRLQHAIVLTLIGKVKRLARADTGGEGRGANFPRVFRQGVQVVRVSLPPSADLGLVVVDDGELGDALRHTGMGVPRVDGEHPRVQRGRLVHAPLLTPQMAEIVERVGIIRLEPEGVLVTPGGVVELLFLLQDVSQVDQAADMPRVEAQGGAQMSDRLGVASDCLQCRAGIVVRLGRIRAKCQHLFAAGQRRGRVAARGQQPPQVHQGRREAGINAERAPEAGDGFCLAARIGQGVAQAEQRLQVSGGVRQHLLEARDRFRVFCLLQEDGEVAASLHHVRSVLQSMTEAADGVPGIAELGVDKSERLE
jgi:hypothetical protein